MYSSQDDDLFEYDPDNEISHNSNPHPYSNAQPNLVSNEKEFVKNIQNTSTLTELSSGATIDGPQVNIAHAFIAASDIFVNQEAPIHAHYYSARHILDELSNGKFSLISMFKSIEYKIYRLMSFLNISDALFGDGGSEINQILSDNFQAQITPSYISMIYEPHAAICRHSLLLNRAAYQKLGEILEINTIPELLSDNVDIENINIQYGKFVNNIESLIFSSLIDQGLTEKVQEEFNLNVTYNQ